MAGSVDYERMCLVAEVVGNEFRVFLVVNLCSFGNEAFGQFAGRAVIAAYSHALCQEVADKGTHAYAAGAYKINGMYIFEVHVYSLIEFLLVILLSVSVPPAQ